jgi:Flp pilus assembly pilin Flp
MNALRMRLRRTVLDPMAGAVSTEYALILTLISVAIIATVALFGDEVAGLFQSGSEAFPSP